MKNENYKKSDWMHKMYTDKQLSVSEIAKICNAHTETIYKWLKRFSIALRKNKIPTKEQLSYMYCDQNMSQQEIANELDIPRYTINYCVKKYDICKKSKNTMIKNTIKNKSSSKPWSDNDIEFLKDNFCDNGISHETFENRLGRSWSAIVGKAYILNLRRNRIGHDAKYRDKEWLYDEFITKNKTMLQIASESGHERKTIGEWIYHFGLKQRKIPTKEELVERYVKNKKSSIDIAEEFGIHKNTVLNLMREHDIPIRSHSEVINMWIYEKGGIDILKKMGIKCSAKAQGIDISEWTHHITPFRQHLRQTGAYKAWRQTVFERDLFTCQDCGQLRGDIHAHHIEHVSEILKNYGMLDNFDATIDSLLKSKIFQVSNGVTLCNKCHAKMHDNIENFVKNANCHNRTHN